MVSEPAKLLREHGLQVTAQRLAVLRTVGALPHATAERIAEGVRGEIGTISRQAVYDALSVMVENGIVRRLQPTGSALLYEYRAGGADHHHVVCRRCGAIADVMLPSPPDTEAVATSSGFAIDEIELTFRGLCPGCRTAPPEG